MAGCLQDERIQSLHHRYHYSAAVPLLTPQSAHSQQAGVNDNAALLKLLNSVSTLTSEGHHE